MSAAPGRNLLRMSIVTGPALAACLLAGAALPAAGQAAEKSQPQPTPQTKAQPVDPRVLGADPKEGRPEVEALLKKVKAAFEPLTAISYRAFSNAYAKVDGKQGPGPDGRMIRKHVFDVQLAKSDTGVWKFAITPDDAADLKAPDHNQGKDTAAPVRATRVAFDSLTLRALRDDEKSVYERTIPSKGHDAADLEAFLDQHGASMTILWDFLDEGNPLGNAGRAAGAYVDRDDRVEGELCTVLRVMDMPGVYVPAAFSDEVATRYKLSKKTNLPLLIERVRPGAAPGSFEVSRSFVLTQWKTNADAEPGDYTIPAPDGYRVRAAEKATIAVKPDKAKAPESGAGVKKPAGSTGAATSTVAVGSQAPDFSLKSADGSTKSLADYKGKLVLMDFWGTWCPPCREAMPGMQNLHKKYKTKGLAVVGMNVERSKTADPAKYMKDRGFDYELLLNAETTTAAYKIRGFPTFLLLDKNGKILWMAVGYDSKHEQELDKLISQHIGL